MSNSTEPGPLPAPAGVLPAATPGALLRRNKWVAILAASLYLVLILIPFKLLLDQQALHRNALDYVTGDDRWVLYRTNIEYAAVLDILLRAEVGDPAADLAAVRTAVDVLGARSDTLKQSNATQRTLGSLPDFQAAIAALDAAIAAAGPILGSEPGPRLTPAALSRLDGIFRGIGPALDGMSGTAMSINAQRKDQLVQGFRQSVVRTGVAAVVLAAASLLFIFWLIRTNRLAKRTQQRLHALTLDLQRSEARLRGFLQNAPVTMSVKDLDGRYLLVNPRSEQYLGLPAKDIIGRTTLDIAATPGHQAVVALEQDVIASNRTQVQQIQYGYGAEAEWYIDIKFPIHDAAGRVTAVGGIGLNVTERKRTEALLVQAQKMEAIGNLTGGVAHDFNNYLAVIMGNLDMLKEDLAEQAAMQKLVEGAMNGALKGAELTQRLLAFARRQPLDPQPTDLNERIADTLPLIERALREDISIELEAAPALWPVLIDGTQFDTCILNLTNNSRDAMPNGGRLRITTRNVHLKNSRPKDFLDIPSDDYVVMEVSDTGVGMTADVQAKMFEPFFTTKGLAHGTGLGLSMVYGFVKQSQGHIRVHSEVDRGTTIAIYLPRVAAGDAKSAPLRSPEPSAAPTGTEIILVVEDNASLRETVTVQLVGLGYQVIAAENAEAALSVLENSGHHVDLLLTDIIMPGALDGIDLADIARRLRPDLKVLLTSGFPGDPLDRKSSAASAHQLLAKPYRQEELARAVRAALGASAPAFAAGVDG